MELKKINITVIAVLALIVTTLFSCVDDFPLPNKVIGEGNAEISATVSFNPLVSTLDRESRAAGDAIKNIETVTVVVYNNQKQLYKIFYNDQLNPSVDIDGNKDMPADSVKYAVADVKGGQAEATTAKASITFPEEIPFGKYYIYAVANVDESLINDETVSTPEDLKRITTEWNPGNVRANSQMFGYFTNVDDQQSYGFDAPESIVNNTHTELHAWIKRSASKVTVVYDGSGLHQGVTVYIHKVTIKDIPKYCALGEFNSPHNLDSLIANGETIYYAKNNEVNGPVDTDLYPDVNSYLNWMPVNKGNGPKGAVIIKNDSTKIRHPETAEALYFYENMQGDYPGQRAFDKRQLADSIGENINKPNQPGYKDNVKYGTYIEVEGYYESTNPNYVSNGKIKYRFMLGKNITYNYNAERNYHYKLTLGFKGWANQPDWHIEYEEDKPDLLVPNRYYVSYLYNHKSMFPVRLVGKAKSLEVRIIENNWAPFDSTAPADDYTSDPVPPCIVGTGEEAFRWNRWVYVCNASGGDPKDPTSGGVPGYFNGKNSPWLGFLALTVPINDEHKALPTSLFQDKTQHWYDDDDHGHRDPGKNSQDLLENYYKGKGGDDMFKTSKYKECYLNYIPQDHREFTIIDPEGGTAIMNTDNNAGYNGCEMTVAPDGSKTVQFPLWTRPKSMIWISGFTGNNPYDTYQRMAKIKITGVFERTGKSDTTITRIVPIYQVRRVVNPKVVWRKWNATDRFHVVLMHRNDPLASTEYTPFESDGEWRASIDAGDHTFMQLDPGLGSKREGEYIVGNTGSNVDFYINFRAPLASHDQTACATIKVEYHGFTCVHTIFVRQGYDCPLDIAGDGTRWSSYSLYSCGNGEKNKAGRYEATLTVSPLALGTLFKRGNVKQGILLKNDLTYKVLEAVNGGSFELSNGTYASWNDISNDNSHEFDGWGEFEAVVDNTDRIYKVPTFEQFTKLMNEDFGFGIMYADGATETAKKPEIAHGFSVFDEKYDTNNNTSEKGMRGVIVYNVNTANQIFFPLSETGMGRRTQAAMPNDNYKGYLRYGGVYWLLDVNKTNHYYSIANVGVPENNRAAAANRFRPIPYSTRSNPGAVYWLDKMGGNDPKLEDRCPAWDFNYFDMNVGRYDTGVLNDAIPIKLIYVGDVK